MSGSSEPFLAWPGWKHLKFAGLVSSVGLVWFLIVYGGCDAITAHRATRIRIHLEAELKIPFVPEMVVFYMSIYLLFIAAPFILRERSEFLALAIALDLVILAGGVGFLLIPAQLAFASPVVLGAFAKLFGLADRLNLTYNLVPSLHVALSVVCIAAYAARTGTPGKLLLWLWAMAIAVSTLLTHQHHVLDVITGAALGLTFSAERLRRMANGKWQMANGKGRRLIRRSAICHLLLAIHAQRDRANGLESISFQPIVHIDVSLSARLVAFPFEYQGSTCLAGLFIHFLDLVIRLECLDRLLIFSAGLEEETGCNQFWIGAAARQRHLLAHRRHRIPGIKYMSDTMAAQTIEIFIAQPILVPHLDRVGPGLRQLAEKRIEVSHEIAAMLVVARPEAREFEQEHSHLGADIFTGFEECGREQVRIQEVPIGLASLGAEAVQLWIRLDGECVRHLEAEPEIVRDLVREPLQVFASGKVVIRGVHTDGLKHFRIFAQTVALEACLGDFAAIVVPLRGVELPKPTLVFPGGSSDENPFGGELRCPFFYRFAVKRHDGPKRNCLGYQRRAQQEGRVRLKVGANPEFGRRNGSISVSAKGASSNQPGATPQVTN